MSCVFSGIVPISLLRNTVISASSFIKSCLLLDFAVEQMFETIPEILLGAVPEDQYQVYFQRREMFGKSVRMGLAGDPVDQAACAPFGDVERREEFVQVAVLPRGHIVLDVHAAQTVVKPGHVGEVGEIAPVST